MLFEPYKLRDLTLRNRLIVSPMCEYSSEDGFANDWHLVHLGSRAVGGAAVVFTEAAAVEPRGRISPQDLGIYKDEHVEMLSRITKFVKGQGAIPAMQIAHAGRKASTRRPWEQPAGVVKPEDGGWTAVGPTTARVCAELSGAGRARRSRDRPDRQGFRRRGEARACGRFRPDRITLRARLSRSRILFAAEQHANR